MLKSRGTCNGIISLEAIASILTWFDYFISAFTADLAALTHEVSCTWMPRGLTEVRRSGHAALRSCEQPGHTSTCLHIPVCFRNYSLFPTPLCSLLLFTNDLPSSHLATPIMSCTSSPFITVFKLLTRISLCWFLLLSRQGPRHFSFPSSSS